MPCHINYTVVTDSAGMAFTARRTVTSYRTIENIPRERVNIITLHLGNGCSIAAIKDGDSVDTSMGLTPLEGLVMGTRSGDLDPAILEFISAKEGLTIHEAETLLNTQSGLLGISGLTNDMRELLAESDENNDRRSRLAIAIFCYRAAKYIGAYLAAMNGSDAVVHRRKFRGGPQMICDRLTWFGLELDSELNRSLTNGRDGVISSTKSRLKVFVVSTNEELLIGRDTVRLIKSHEATPVKQII